MKPAFVRPAWCLLCSVLLAGSFSSIAADWPQWRGPDRSDRSAESGLLKSWPEGGPKQLWVFKNAGLGYSGFSVVGKQLFTMGAREDAEYLISLDVANGTELWKAKMGDILRNAWGDGPRGTPTVDGDFVYALGGDGTLVCVQKADGKEVWRHTMSELGGVRPTWGFTESVLVDGDRVFCTPGGAKGALAAFDKATGKVVWRSEEFIDPAQYASMIAVNCNGARQLIQLTMKSFVGIDEKTGKLLWKSDWLGQTAVIPSPIFKDNRVYVSSGYGAGCKLIKIDPDNSIMEVYSSKVMKNHHGGVVLVDGKLYGYSDGPGWVCQDFLTGDEVWAEKGKLGKGAVSYADGMLYLLEESTGHVVLIEASPKGWNEKGRFKLDPQTTQRSPKGKIWTHPVIANGHLYLRDQELVFCYDVKAK